MALVYSGDTLGVTVLESCVGLAYLALNVCATSVAESSDTAASENYTVSITIMPTRLYALT
jgi:hypothetical protein